jgi:hypothetical protein
VHDGRAVAADHGDVMGEAVPSDMREQVAETVDAANGDATVHRARIGSELSLSQVGVDAAALIVRVDAEERHGSGGDLSFDSAETALAAVRGA